MLENANTYPDKESFFVCTTFCLREYGKEDKSTFPIDTTYCPVRLPTLLLLCNRTNCGKTTIALKYIENAQNQETSSGSFLSAMT